MVDSYAMSSQKKRMLKTQANDVVDTLENGSHVLEKEHGSDVAANAKSQLIRYQVIAQHVKRWKANQTTTKGLWCTRLYANHQLIVSSVVLTAQYGGKTRWAMVFFFSVTTPFGIALGMVLQTVYSPTALIVVGVLNACSVGLLNYMALVDLLGADFWDQSCKET
uniref:Uncharacterized protein n=2 Tax=Brassica oleracea TaxID=3712 RepID=A0A3P6ED82_BRAOL|nr:unnamed protein product [Brassica oleracea]